MTPEIRTLTEQAIALPGWKWLPGMRVLSPASGRGVHLQEPGSPSGICGAPPAGWLPDLTDPATGAALLSLMTDPSLELGRGRDAAPAWYCLVCPDEGEWVPGYGDTPGEAIARLAVKRGRWT